MTDGATFRLAVAVATRGRPTILAQTLGELARQTRQPDRVLVCGTGPGDVDASPDGRALPDGTEVLFALPGLPRQRNAILDRLDDCDAVLFLDDDFLMTPRYIEATVAALTSHPDLVVTTGTLIADDARGPGLAFEAGQALIAADRAYNGRDHGSWDHDGGPDPAQHGYGCNMAVRLDPVRRHAERFDERLPLYAWSEDIDFTHRMARHGWIAKLRGARGVHLGTKAGRTPGRRLGYSQVANPVYLFHKGSYSFGRAARSVARNLAMNAAKALRPEPYVDRRGRLRGNGLALLDMLRGRMTPERILDL